MLPRLRGVRADGRTGLKLVGARGGCRAAGLAVVSQEVVHPKQPLTPPGVNDSDQREAAVAQPTAGLQRVLPVARPASAVRFCAGAVLYERHC